MPALRPMCGLVSRVVFCNSGQRARRVDGAGGVAGVAVGIVRRVKSRLRLPQ